MSRSEKALLVAPLPVASHSEGQMVDSTDPLDGDLGLRLTCSPPEEQEGEPWAPPSASASPPTSDPHPQLTQTTRGDSVAAAALDSDTLARLGRTVVTFALVDFDIDAGPVRLSLSHPLRLTH